jgi:hypothetical protein
MRIEHWKQIRLVGFWPHVVIRYSPLTHRSHVPFALGPSDVPDHAHLDQPAKPSFERDGFEEICPLGLRHVRAGQVEAAQ